MTWMEMQNACEHVTRELCLQLNRELNPFGHVITEVLINKVDANASVVKSLNDIIIAQNNRISAKANAEAQAQAAIVRAEGDAEVHKLAGKGIANCRHEIVAGLKNSVEEFRAALPDSDPSSIMAAIMMQQYLEVMKEAAVNGQHTFILPSTPTHATNLEEQMRTALLTTAPPKIRMSNAGKSS
jgi:regulator of protease activity HflC (stomatin/prohibitin superfamily)